MSGHVVAHLHHYSSLKVKAQRQLQIMYGVCMFISTPVHCDGIDFGESGEQLLLVLAPTEGTQLPQAPKNDWPSQTSSQFTMQNQSSQFFLSAFTFTFLSPGSGGGPCGVPSVIRPNP